MKVLVCIPCLLTGGTEIQTLSLVEALVYAGHKVCVACYFEYTESMVERYRKAEAKVFLLSSKGERPTGVIKTLKHLWTGLKNVVKEFQPDVAHVQYMAPGALPIILLKALGTRRIIATAHTAADIYTPNGLRAIRFLTRNFLTAFQCITERAEIGFFGNSKLFDGTLSKHFTIYNNIPSHLTIRETPRPLKEECEIITVGVVSRLEMIKGMDLVVPAFASASEEDKRLRLLVVGEGLLYELMHQQAEETNLRDRIEFIGRKNQYELQSYYDKIDILLMPSRSEGFGLTAVEGMARGCVPIVANVGGLPEIVNESFGIIHSSEDISAISNGILYISNNRHMMFDMSIKAVKTAGEFSSLRYYRLIKELYSLL